MDRRSFLRTTPISLMALGGCLGEEASGGFSNDGADGPEDDDGAENDDETSGDGAAESEILTEEVEALRDQFEQRGLRVLDARIDEEAYVFEIQTTGNVDEDIRVASGAYATVVDRLDRDLRVRVVDRGIYRETFEIRHEWADMFLHDRMSDNEYLEKINDTRSG